MTESVADLADLEGGRLAGSRWGVAWARRLVLAQLRQIEHGTLELVELAQGEEGKRREQVFRGAGALRATVTVRDPRFYSKVALGGSVGAGESYMAGHWQCDDLTALVRILVLNRELLDGMEEGWARLAAPFLWLYHRVHRNTREGSRRNIGAHYDLGNDFFATFLDREHRMYSCAVFESDAQTLEQASEAKLARIGRKLDLGPEDHLLEIGTGWGGLALFMAQRYGCRVTTTTISPAQFQHAQQRVHEAGLEGQITVLQKDYRQLEGRFDKLVSVEMVEAVGLSYLDSFFAHCSRLLDPRGLMLLQGITMADRFFARAARSVDFIQRYIFPGSALPSIGALASSIGRSDLTVVHLEDIGEHYARTLRIWRQRFFRQLATVRQLGFSEAFVRMWEFYLCYCEGGFLERSVSDVQVLLAKPGNRRPSPLGSLG